MTRIVIAGGGFAGLAGAIFCARRGHHVTIIERDGPPPGATADEDAEGWRRPGAPQRHQSHAFLGCAAAILAAEAPDVLDALIARGVRRQAVPLAGGDGTLLLSRRLVAEAVLRRAAEREPGVDIRTGDAVTGLRTEAENAGLPLVTGVHTAVGGVMDADLVVDAGGRRSALPSWLEACGARSPVDERQELGFFYLTRYYRDRPGQEHPATRVPGALPLDYGAVMAFGADNGTFSLSLTLSVDDPHRHAMRDPRRFESVFAAIASTAAWLAVGEAISDISMMARIENRRRRLVDDRGPVVAGLVCLGDAGLHTNPTLGRGVSLAFSQAQHLAATAGHAAEDPAGYVAAYDGWTQAHLGAWYDTQVALDAGGMARLDAGLRGERPPPPSDPIAQRIAAAFALSATDSIVGDAVRRFAHMLAPPAQALSDPDVAQRLDAFLATHPDLERPPDPLQRPDFERLATV